MKSITDNEVDLLMESSASASEIYLMKHFRHDVMKSTTDQNILNSGILLQKISKTIILQKQILTKINTLFNSKRYGYDVKM